MTKITLTNLVNLNNQTTAVNAINANNAVLIAAVDNTLSRNGSQPNPMTANLDMNSNRLLNLAAPISSNEPARLIDLATVAAGGSVSLSSIPTGGTAGQLLGKNSSSNFDVSWLPAYVAPTLTIGSTAMTLGNTYTTITGGITWSNAQTFSASNVYSSRQNFTNNVAVGNGTYTGDDSAVLINRALTPGSGLLNSHAVRDETNATQNVTAAGFSGYASFDSAAQISGTATTATNHFRNFQARGTYASTGLCNEMAGLWVGQSVNNSSASIGQMFGVHITQPNLISGIIQNQYAFYSDILSGATSNYFIFQGGAGNPSVFPGNIYIGGLLSQLSVEKVNIQFNGVSQYGLLTNDSNSAAGGGTAINFFRNSISVGTIVTTLTTTAYNTSSDERLKDFIGSYDPKKAIAIIKTDPVRDFHWKSTGDYAVGWGAQTSYAVSPDLAHKPEDDSPWSIDPAKRTPYLWAAMSDVLDRLERLENGTET